MGGRISEWGRADGKRPQRRGAVVASALFLSTTLFSAGTTLASSTSEMYRTKAVIPIAERDYAQAKSLLNKAVADDGEDALAWYYLGLVESRSGNDTAAQKNLARARILGLNHPELFYELGYAYFRLAQYPQAVESFSQAVTQRPDDIRSHYYQGLSLSRQGEFEQALQPFQRAADGGGEFGTAARYRLVEIDKELANATKAQQALVSLLADEAGAVFFTHRLLPLESGRSRHASDFATNEPDVLFALLNDAVRQSPQERRLHFYLGVLASRQGDHPLALAELEPLRSAGLAHRELALELGIAYYGQGDYAKAVAALRRAVAGGARPMVSGYYLAAAYAQTGQYEQALGVLEEAAAIKTDGVSGDPASTYLRAEVLHQLARDTEAVEVLKQLLASGADGDYELRAKAMLAELDSRSPSVKPYRLELSAGFLRDSNVGLYADDVTLPDTIEDRADNRWQLALDGKWKPMIGEDSQLTLGYRFFQSLHQRLDDYDLRQHALSADWRQQQEHSVWGVNGQYSVASLGEEAYVTSYRLVPNLLMQHSQRRSSLLQLSLGHEQYDYPDLSGYDGNRYQAGYRHYWRYAGEHYYYLGGTVQRSDTDDETVTYNAAGINAGLSAGWQHVLIGADLQYQRKAYPDALLERDDDYYRVDLSMTYPLTSHIKMDVTASHIENRTDAAAFDYSRTLYGMTMRWQL